MNQEGFSNKTILIILMVIVLVGGGIFIFKRDRLLTVQPTKTKEAGLAEKYREDTWKTYKNSFGFEFKYPRDWRVVADNQTNGQVKIVSWGSGEPETSNGFVKDGASVEMTHEKEGADLKVVRDSIIEPIKSGPVKLFYESSRTIDSKPASRITYLTEKGVGVTEYLIPVNKIVYRLRLSVSTSAEPHIINILNTAFASLPDKIEFGK